MKTVLFLVAALSASVSFGQCVTCGPQPQVSIQECVTCEPMQVVEYVPQVRTVNVPQITQTLHLSVPVKAIGGCNGGSLMTNSLTSSRFGGGQVRAKLRQRCVSRLASRLASKVVATNSVNTGAAVMQVMDDCECVDCDCGGDVAPPAPPAPAPAATSMTMPVSTVQSWAQWEANEMARRRYKNHILRGSRLPSGVKFAGVGFSSRGPNVVPTCTPPFRRGYVLIADAVARGPDGWYRARYWGNG